MKHTSMNKCGDLFRSALDVQKSVVRMEFKAKCTGSSGDVQGGVHMKL